MMSYDKAVTRKSGNRPRRNLMTFKQFLLSKQRGSAAGRETGRVKSAIKKLREQTDVDDPFEAVFAAIEVGAPDREATLRLLVDEIRKMSEKMDIAVSCVPL